MEWISRDKEHEGWVAALAPDPKIVSDETITGWCGACECGWQGEVWVRVFRPFDADSDTRREYVSPGEPVFVSGRTEEAIHKEWLAHIARSEGVGVEATAPAST